MAEFIRGSECLTCFVLSFSGPMVSPFSLDLNSALYVICCTAVIHSG